MVTKHGMIGHVVYIVLCSNPGINLTVLTCVFDSKLTHAKSVLWVL